MLSACVTRVFSCKQRHVALAHDVQIDGVERGHGQDAGEQAVDLELRGSTPVMAPASAAGHATRQPWRRAAASRRTSSMAATAAPSVMEPPP